MRYIGLVRIAITPLLCTRGFGGDSKQHKNAVFRRNYSIQKHCFPSMDVFMKLKPLIKKQVDLKFCIRCNFQLLLILKWNLLVAITVLISQQIKMLVFQRPGAWMMVAGASGWDRSLVVALWTPKGVKELTVAAASRRAPKVRPLIYWSYETGFMQLFKRVTSCNTGF